MYGFSGLGIILRKILEILGFHFPMGALASSNFALLHHFNCLDHSHKHCQLRANY